MKDLLKLVGSIMGLAFAGVVFVLIVWVWMAINNGMVKL